MVHTAYHTSWQKTTSQELGCDIRGDNALSDAAGRLADDLADTALGVCYPHSPHQSSQLTANSKIWISPIGGSWHETDIEGIAGMVRRSAAEAGDVDAEASDSHATDSCFVEILRFRRKAADVLF